MEHLRIDSDRKVYKLSSEGPRLVQAAWGCGFTQGAGWGDQRSRDVLSLEIGANKTLEKHTGMRILPIQLTQKMEEQKLRLKIG